MPKKTGPSKSAQIADLQRQLMELRAQMPGSLKAASTALNRFSTEHCMASAVVLSVSVLGGRSIEPFAIRDGLSAETISSLQADIQRSLAP